MSATHYDRIQRLKRLEQLLPRPGAPESACLDGARILEILGDAYDAKSQSASRRALQRDLAALVKEGRIEAVNPGGKPLRYRRLKDLEDDTLIWEYTLRQVRDLIAEAIPRRQLDRLWERLLYDTETPLLTDNQLRIVSDTLRLRPVELFPEVLHAVIAALSSGRALQAVYKNASGERSEPVIHPQALVQRGPIPYLFALKNDEDSVRLYALHRFIRAEVLDDHLGRQAVDFNLDRALAEGKVDFGQGQMIDLEIRVRGYLTSLLMACPLSEDQRWEDEPDGSDYHIRIHAHLPQTGQLLRWLLGAGDNLEVIQPEALRETVAEQIRKMTGIYASN